MLGTTTALAATAAVIAGGILTARLLPGGRGAAGAQSVPGKRATLEGLRGLLALGVVAHHLVILRSYAATGRWTQPAGNFDTLIGKGAVAVFFMLSAYLFCGTMIARGGWLAAPDPRRGPIAARLLDPLRFLVGRARRILPAYLFTVALLVLMVGVETRFTLREPVGQVLREIGWWLLLGWDPVDINGFAATWKMFSVTWSLQTEVQFYLIVPLLALGARYLGRFAPVVLLIVPGMLYDWWPLFAAGALAVPIAESRLRAWRWPAIAGLAALVWTQHTPSGWLAAGLLLPAFVGAAQGGRGFGWLGRAPMVRLGKVSYSLYLLHNPVIYMVGLWLVGRAGIASAGLGPFALICAATSIAAVIFAMVVQHWVERPFMTHPGSRGIDRRPGRHPAPPEGDPPGDIRGDDDQHERASIPPGARSDAATVTKELRPWPI